MTTLHIDMNNIEKKSYSYNCKNINSIEVTLDDINIYETEKEIIIRHRKIEFIK